jgi:hypothetical protein
MSLLPAVGSPLNCGTFVGPSAPTRTFNKRVIPINPIRLRAEPVLRLYTPANTSLVPFASDWLLSRNTQDSFITDYTVSAEYALPGGDNSQLTITSLDPSKLSSPTNGLATGLIPGSLALRASNPDGQFVDIPVGVGVTGGAYTEEFSSFAPGSLAKHCADQIDNRLVGLTASSTTKNIFSTYNGSAATYVRNPNCWAAGIDMTGLSPWNSTLGQNTAGTLISPRHVLWAAHYPPSVGATVHFVDNNNNVVVRTISSMLTHPDYNNPSGTYEADIRIGLLDSDVPNTISFLKILPSNIATYLPSISTSDALFSYTNPTPTGAHNARIPVFLTDQAENALVYTMGRVYNNSSFWIAYKPATTQPQRVAFHEDIVTGDSGSPACLVVNNQLVVFGVVTSTYSGGQTGSRSSLPYFKDSVNAMMTTLGGGYQLTEADLSGFTQY